VIEWPDDKALKVSNWAAASAPVNAGLSVILGKKKNERIYAFK
jgi:hypothetical protein